MKHITDRLNLMSMESAGKLLMCGSADVRLATTKKSTHWFDAIKKPALAP